MIDPFLEEIFLSNAIAASLSRNTVYQPACPEVRKREFRRALAKRLQQVVSLYMQAPVSDAEHYEVIRRYCCELSYEFGEQLASGRFRYGTAQKALNLYLKFLWRAGAMQEPPQCPVDGVVLREAGIDGAWTKCDSQSEYSGWISTLRARLKGHQSLAEWEHSVWLKNRRS